MGQLVSAKLVGSGLMLKEMRQRHAHSVLKVSMDSPKEGSRKKVRVKIALQVDLLKHMDRQQHVLGVLPVLIAKIKAWICTNDAFLAHTTRIPIKQTVWIVPWADISKSTALPFANLVQMVLI